VVNSFRVGGSELVGVELAGQLAAAGVRVYCAALEPGPGPLLARCASHGIEVVDLEIPRSNLFGRNGVSIGLARRLRALRLDALHVQHFIALNKLGLPARIAAIPRTVVTEHSVVDVSSTRAVRFRIRLNWRLANTIAVVHPGIRDYLCQRLGVPLRRIEVVPLGIEVARFHRTDRNARREALGLGTDAVFIFAGRLAAVKNVPGLVGAFLDVQARGAAAARLIVLGDGEERAAVQALVATHPLGSRVSLVGEQADVRSYLAAADVFVLNSRSEGTPRALLEAMATGLPAICPAVGDIPEIIRGRGWLTQPCDRVSLEDAMCSCLESPALVEDYGRACQAYVRENFDAGRSVERYQQLLFTAGAAVDGLSGERQ
jgi:glycosyltransferase involved in cell wall biosynthesis